MGIRAMGSATIAFGLVSVPVKIYSTVDSTHAVRFSFRSPGGNKLSQQYVDAENGKVVEYADRLRGYEYAKGKYVVFSPEEVKALDAAPTKAINIEEFVEADMIDRYLVDKSYYMAPDGDPSAKAFHLLRAALAKSGKMAIARYAVRGRDNLVAIRVMGDGLILEHLKLVEELRVHEDVPLNVVDISNEELALAEMLVAQKSVDGFDHAKHKDVVRERIMAMVQEKVDNGAISINDAAPKQEVASNDILEALKASVGELGKAA